MRAVGTEAPEIPNARLAAPSRARVIAADDGLRARARSGYYSYEQLLATLLGHDLGQSPDTLKPHLTAITGLREFDPIRGSTDGQRHDATPALLHLVDEVIAFARAGLSARSQGVRQRAADRPAKPLRSAGKPCHRCPRVVR